MIRRLARDCRGAAAVEAAIVVPVLAALGFGAADGAWMFAQTHTLEAGLTAGGSYLAQAGAGTLSEDRARQIAVTGDMVPGRKARIRGWSPSHVTIRYVDTANDGLYRGSGAVRVARLETTVPYQGLGILRGLVGGELTLEASFETRLTP